MNGTSGTFAGTGQSESVKMIYGQVLLNFGTGTVVVEYSQDDSTWYPMDASTFTSDVMTNIHLPLGGYVRLNCTAHSSDISYVLRGADDMNFVG